MFIPKPGEITRRSWLQSKFAPLTVMGRAILVRPVDVQASPMFSLGGSVAFLRCWITCSGRRELAARLMQVLLSRSPLFEAN
ncbi:hypothetical protein M413DRAFT_448566 [Hebeloma cylindrosporum]|uniref:Uncharacterized protein n=1 Tax=Hebeloma cylindrosporum TaxID=76867 RepID=A0A0C2XHB3_HEBCY|nr:hypothetical protein M413DRAFT_448566 [Hebeloma cylindrosporum h7]